MLKKVENVLQIVENAEIYAQGQRIEARQYFHAFRRYIRPGMLWGWWNGVVAVELQQFYNDFVAGKRPKMAICTPPQHGKSWTAVDFISWVSGRNPDLKTIFASFSDDLGIRTNTDLQRRFDGDLFRQVFPRFRIGKPGTNAWKRNSELIEFVRRAGSFRNTTVEGAINGMELHLGVIDDPVKGRNESMSPTTRNRIWNWFTDDWMARFSADSAMLIIATRWHVDDLIGRYLQIEPGLKVVSFPAIAEHNEYFIHEGVKHRLRRKGQAIFHELKPLDFLLERKKLMTESSWQSEYQQHPIIVGGGILPIDKFKVMPYWAPHNSTEIIATVRSWDKAGTEGGGAYTAGVLMHSLKDGRYVISHVARGQWSAYEREKNIRQWAVDDSKIFSNYEIVIEQEPGSGGKDSAAASIRNLAGFSVFIDKVTGSKEIRAQPFAAQVQNDRVLLIAGDWCKTYLDEAEAFPNSMYKDQIDASSGGFNRLAAKLKFDSSFGWV